MAAMSAACAESDCVKPRRARGACTMHYQRARTAGTLDERYPQQTTAERFWEKVDVGHPLGCWLWTGALTRDYGSFWLDGNQRPAHRYSYELLRGPIPDGLQMDHLCRVKHCVNPDHLDPVTPATNLRRAPLWTGNAAHRAG